MSMGYNPFCQYYRHRAIPPPAKPGTGLQSLFSAEKSPETIRIHECYRPDNLDAAGKLHRGSWTCDKKPDCPYKKPKTE